MNMNKKVIYIATIDSPRKLSERQRIRLELAITDIVRAMFDLDFMCNDNPAPFCTMRRVVDDKEA